MPEHHDSVDSDVEALSGIELLDRVGVRRSPFATGADFSFMTSVPDSNRSFTKEPSIIERKAYRDTWGRGLDGYLGWFYSAAAALHALLKSTGSVYIHLDWHVASYARPPDIHPAGPLEAPTARQHRATTRTAPRTGRLDISRCESCR